MRNVTTQTLIKRAMVSLIPTSLAICRTKSVATEAAVTFTSVLPIRMVMSNRLGCLRRDKILRAVDEFSSLSFCKNSLLLEKNAASEPEKKAEEKSKGGQKLIK